MKEETKRLDFFIETKKVSLAEKPFRKSLLIALIGFCVVNDFDHFFITAL